MAEKRKMEALIDYGIVERNKHLTPSQFGNLMRALLQYAETKVEPDQSDQVTWLLFYSEKPRLDAKQEAYDEKCKRNALIAQEREERKRASQQAPQSTSVQETKEISTDDTDTDIDSDIDTDSDLDYGERYTVPPPETPSQNLKIPTFQEIENFCKARNSVINAKTFFTYYENQKWRKANGKPVNDWQGEVCVWETRERGGGRGSGASPPKQKTAEELQAEIVELQKRSKGVVC